MMRDKCADYKKNMQSRYGNRLIVSFNQHLRQRFCDDCRWRTSSICKSFKMKYTSKFFYFFYHFTY